MQVELLKPHTHAGTPRAPGTVITLDDDLARWLVADGVAQVSATPSVAPPSPKRNQRNEEPSQ